MSARRIRREHARRAKRAGLATGSALAATIALAPAAQGATFTVDSNADAPSDGCDPGACTLRDAVSEATANAEADTITFAPSVTGKITLTVGPLGVSDPNDLTITGPGASALTVSGDADGSGGPTAGDSRVFVVPRRPTNLFVAATTPDQWTSVYNHFYAPGGILCGMTTCFDRPQTYQEILDHESDYLLRYLLRGDLDPWMFHVGNTRAYSGNRSVLSDLLDETFSKYSSMVNTPVRSVSFKQAGQAMQGRAAYNAAGVTATVTPCTSITVKATKAATVPVNGVAYTAANSTVEAYGGRTISQVRLAAGQTVTIPLPAC